MGALLLCFLYNWSTLHGRGHIKDAPAHLYISGEVKRYAYNYCKNHLQKFGAIYEAFSLASHFTHQEIYLNFFVLTCISILILKVVQYPFEAMYSARAKAAILELVLF